MDQKIEEMKPAELVAAYNAAAEKLGLKPVKKFETKAKGQARVVEVLAKVAALKPAKKAAKVNGEKKVTVAGRIKGLVLDGFDNQAIWAVVQKEFGLPDSKKNYPAWYRRDLAKRGA